jgi:hypothetical protein
MTTWTVGQLVTAALMNSNIQALGAFVLAPPLACCYQSTAQSIATGTTGAPLLLDTNVLDSDSGHSTTSNTTEDIVQVAGTYLVFGQVGFQATAAGGRGCAIYQNLLIVPRIQPEAVSAGSVLSSAITFIGFLACAVGDVIQIYGWQNSGGALSTQPGGSCLNVLRVSN